MKKMRLPMKLKNYCHSERGHFYVRFQSGEAFLTAQNKSGRHDRNCFRVIFIIAVCSSVAFTNCDSRHQWLAANAEFYKEIL